MPPKRIIKKYANRKLYDVTTARYISMCDVASFVAAGEDVTIVDDRTERDITILTLARALYERIKGHYGSAKKSELFDDGAVRLALVNSIQLVPK
jgi:polyhydroxyalkanoate synthesis repressor PhaR